MKAEVNSGLGFLFVDNWYSIRFCPDKILPSYSQGVSIWLCIAGIVFVDLVPMNNQNTVINKSILTLQFGRESPNELVRINSDFGDRIVR